MVGAMEAEIVGSGSGGGWGVIPLLIIFSLIVYFCFCRRSFIFCIIFQFFNLFIFTMRFDGFARFWLSHLVY